MLGRDLVVVGGSAGGVEALLRLVERLPPELPATVLVNLHMASESPSLLPRVLGRDAAIRVVSAHHGMPLEHGQVVVGVPDRHLLVVEDRIELGWGPRENNHRPSHDAMLRSAALARGPRVIGVVLTGLLGDGSVGLRCVARYGGACLVQEPSDAQFPDMPLHALAAVPEAVRAPLGSMVEELVTMVDGRPAHPPEVPEDRRMLDIAERDSARGLRPLMPDGSIPGEPTSLACPDCHGVLHRIPDDGHTLRFRCRTGHAWTAESLVAQQDVALEQALWTALRALEERAEVSDRLAARFQSGGSGRPLDTYQRRAAEAREAAQALRQLLLMTAPDVPDDEQHQ